MKQQELLLRMRFCTAILPATLKRMAMLLQQKTQINKKQIFEVLQQPGTHPEQLWRQLFTDEIDRLLRLNLQNGSIITILDAAYPSQLREIYDPPAVLFYRGNWDLTHCSHLLGVVGSRKHSAYAPLAIKKLLTPLLARGLITVSGLAAGVDQLAHSSSLAVAKPTIAVIGNGLNIFYPKTNQNLQQRIEQNGLVISEYGINERPLRYHFPARNRIIAGLVPTLLVVEARHHSGSLITANSALQENRNVLAVPGPINSLFSQGTNELIAAGAKPVLQPDDIWEEFL